MGDRDQQSRRYHEAHATTDAERYHRVPLPWADDVEAIREMSGARGAESAMGILSGKLHTMARLVETAPVSTVEGLRAAMYECLPGVADNAEGFDFGEYDQPVKMLFRACISVTGLSELGKRLEARLGKGET